jgi:hypothetical protein
MQSEYPIIYCLDYSVLLSPFPFQGAFSRFLSASITIDHQLPQTIQELSVPRIIHAFHFIVIRKGVYTSKTIAKYCGMLKNSMKRVSGGVSVLITKKHPDRKA